MEWAYVSVNRGDYLIVQLDTEKKSSRTLARVLHHTKQGELVVIPIPKKIEGKSLDTKSVTTLYSEQVLAWLGASPEIGTAYGINTEPYIRSKYHKRWGNIHFFVDLNEEEERNLLTLNR